MKKQIGNVLVIVVVILVALALVGLGIFFFTREGSSKPLFVDRIITPQSDSGTSLSSLGWELYTPIEGYFTIMFPGQVGKLTKDIKTPGNYSIVLSIHASPFPLGEDPVYTASTGQLPLVADTSNPKKVLQDYVSGITSVNVGGTLVSSTPIQFRDYEAVDLTITTKDGLKIKSKIFIKGKVIYALATESKSEKFDYHEEFVDSFNFR